MFNRQAGLPVDALVQHLTDAANRASVVIYSIDPRGLQVHSPTAADDTRNSSPRQVAAVPMRRNTEEFYSRDGMVALAAGTGGLFLRDTNDLDGAVREVVRDTEGYYLIGYHPDSSTFERKGGQALFHKVTVRVKRAGLQVRSRSGFFGAPDRESQGTPAGREGEICTLCARRFRPAGLMCASHRCLTTPRRPARTCGPCSISTPKISNSRTSRRDTIGPWSMWWR